VSAGAENGGSRRPYVVILGTNEVASAIAIVLRRAGGRVVLAHDPIPQVLRRGMAFHDALFGDPAVIDGVQAERADTTLEVGALVTCNSGVVVTTLGLLDLITLDRLDVLIDARLQSTTAKPDLRWLARISIGLGTGFRSDDNCDVAVDPPEAAPAPLGETGARQTVRSAMRGIWRTPVEIGTHVFKGFVVGHLDGVAIRTPIDAVITGAVRDGTEVMRAADLVEIDPRVRETQWRGVDARGQAAAAAVLAAIEARQALQASGGTAVTVGAASTDP
jgi:hypothetical protein